MATWYAQYATNWSDADPTSGGDPAVTSIWNDAADGSGAWGNPSAADVCHLNGFDVNWDFDLDGGAFAGFDVHGSGSLSFTGSSNVVITGATTFESDLTALAFGGVTHPTLSSVTVAINKGFSGYLEQSTGVATVNATSTGAVTVDANGVLFCNAVISGGITNGGIVFILSGNWFGLSITNSGANNVLVTVPPATNVPNPGGVLVELPQASDVKTGVSYGLANQSYTPTGSAAGGGGSFLPF